MSSIGGVLDFWGCTSDSPGHVTAIVYGPDGQEVDFAEGVATEWREVARQAAAELRRLADEYEANAEKD